MERDRIVVTEDDVGELPEDLFQDKENPETVPCVICKEPALGGKDMCEDHQREADEAMHEKRMQEEADEYFEKNPPSHLDDEGLGYQGP